MQNDTQELCEHCGYEMSFFNSRQMYQSLELCPTCHLLAMAPSGRTEQLSGIESLNKFIVGRLVSIFDLVLIFEATADICDEVLSAGRRPSSGLEAALSEHHLLTEVCGRVEAVSQETAGVCRSVVRTLLPTIDQYPEESAFVFETHPGAQLVAAICDHLDS